MNFFKILLTNKLNNNSNKLKELVIRFPNVIQINKKNQLLHRSNFHLSSNHCINPVFWLLFKPLSRVVTIISGRRIRFWWKQLSPEKKAKLKQNVKDNPLIWFAPLSLFIIGFSLYYSNHMQATPITGRRRYMSMNKDHIKFFSEQTLLMIQEENKKNIVPTTHKVYDAIYSIINRLVESNKDIEIIANQNWEIIVIESNEAQAFVLPTGHIFVHTGLCNVVRNDDQLAFILAHEMSHALLCHAAENINYLNLLDIIGTVFLTAIWAIMPTDGLALLLNWIYNKLTQVMLQLPYSRNLEIEADKVGLQLIAKACYDVRESSILWQNWSKLLESDKETTELPQFLSTHPSFENRTKLLDNIMPQAISLRKRCNCPSLQENHHHIKA